MSFIRSTSRIIGVDRVERFNAWQTAHGFASHVITRGLNSGFVLFWGHGEGPGCIDYTTAIAAATLSARRCRTEKAPDAGETAWYGIRQVKDGLVECNTTVVARLGLDGSRDRLLEGPLSVVGLGIEQVSGPRIRLMWFHGGMGSVEPVQFEVITDHGTGTWDEAHPVGRLSFTGAGTYEWTSEVLTEELVHRFKVLAVGSEGQPDWRPPEIEELIRCAPSGPQPETWVQSVS